MLRQFKKIAILNEPEPSIFERAWILPLLIILTIGGIGITLSFVYSGKKIPITFFTTVAVIIPLWVGYWNAGKRKQQQ